jgi:hypothetical protein
MDKEVAQFTLLSINASSINSTKSIMTWNNIELPVLLGSMYNKYSRFKLCCYSISSNQSGLSITSNDANVNIYLSGLPLEFPYYNPSTNKNENQQYLGNLTLFVNGYSHNIYPTRDGIVFRKEQNLANLTIQLLRSKDNTNTFSTQLGQFAFSFIVYGIEE